MISNDVNCPKKLDISRDRFDFIAILSRKSNNAGLFGGNVSANSISEYIEYDEKNSINVGDIVQDYCTKIFYYIQSIEYTGRFSKRAFLQKTPPIILPRYLKSRIGARLPLVIIGKQSRHGSRMGCKLPFVIIGNKSKRIGRIGSRLPLIVTGKRAKYNTRMGAKFPLIVTGGSLKRSARMGSRLPLVIIGKQKKYNSRIGGRLPLTTT